MTLAFLVSFAWEKWRATRPTPPLSRKCGFKKVVDIQRFGLKATNNSDDESYIF